MRMRQNSIEYSSWRLSINLWSLLSACGHGPELVWQGQNTSDACRLTKHPTLETQTLHQSVHDRIAVGPHVHRLHNYVDIAGTCVWNFVCFRPRCVRHRTRCPRSVSSFIATRIGRLSENSISQKSRVGDAIGIANAFPRESRRDVAVIWKSHSSFPTVVSRSLLTLSRAVEIVDQRDVKQNIKNPKRRWGSDTRGRRRQMPRRPGGRNRLEIL